MADNTHSMSTRNRLKTDRASIINPTALTSHKTTTNTPANTATSPTARDTVNPTANTAAQPNPPTLSNPSTKKSKAAAAVQKAKPTTNLSLNNRKRITARGFISNSEADVEMPDADIAPLPKSVPSRPKAIAKKPTTTITTTTRSSSGKNPITTKQVISDSEADVEMQDADTTPLPKSVPSSPKPTAKKPNSSSSRSNPGNLFKPKAPTARKSVSFGTATSEAATQTEDTEISESKQKVHSAYPSLPPGVPRDEEGIPSRYYSNINGNILIRRESGGWEEAGLKAKITTDEFNDAIDRARQAKKCTGGDECSHQCPLYKAQGHRNG